MKNNVYRVRTKHHGGLKSGLVSCELETQSPRNLCVWALSCWMLQSAAKVKLSPQMHKSDCFGQFWWLQW